MQAFPAGFQATQVTPTPTELPTSPEGGPPNTVSLYLGPNNFGNAPSPEASINWLLSDESLELDFTSIPAFNTEFSGWFPDHIGFDCTSRPHDSPYQLESHQLGTFLSISGKPDVRPDRPAANYDHNASSLRTASEESTSPSTAITISPSSGVSLGSVSETSCLYTSSSDGARVPCTARPRIETVNIIGATPLSKISDTQSAVDEIALDVGFTDLSHITYTQLFLPPHSSELSVETYKTARSRFDQLCLDDRGVFHGVFPPYRATSFPSMEFLNLFAQLFFQYFNPIIPIIHRDHVDINDYWLLALAVCAVGSQYTETTELSSCIVPLHEFVRRGLILETEFCRNCDPAVSLLLAQTMVISQIGMLYYGSRELHEIARVRHGDLVEKALDLSLLSRSGRGELPAITDTPSEQRWRDWLDEEARRRLGYSIWV